MATDCADVCSAVIDKLLAAGFTKKELKIDNGNHDAILGALEKVKLLRGGGSSLTIYFSYDTIMAFNDGRRLVVSENRWLKNYRRWKAIGKHLDQIDGGRKKGRLTREKFEAELEKVLTAHGLKTGTSI